MATIQVVGKTATATLFTHSDSEYGELYRFGCTKGAWCDVPDHKDWQFDSRDEAIEAATVHVDFHDKEADE